MRRFSALAVVASLAVGSVTATAGGRTLTTALTGAQEVPGPGDADASGTATITLNEGQDTVCFSLGWSGIDGTVVASHIHAAPAGVAGPVVVPLFTGGAFSGTDSASGCVENVSADLIKAIRHDPEQYYVNIHSTVFPTGAVRGQLTK